MTITERMNYIYSLGKMARYDEALDEIAAIERAGVISPKLKMIKGAYIQLGESDKYNLEEAEACFREAIDLDDQNPEAYLELGWYFLNVKDLPENAISYFSKAKELAQRSVSEAIDGLSKAQSYNN